MFPAFKKGLSVRPAAETTMGMLLSIPLFLFGIGMIVVALRRPRLNASPAAAQ